MPKKQYVYEKCYADNYRVISIVDGKIEMDEIVPYYELSGYISYFNNNGYTLGFYIKNLEKELLKISREYDRLQKEYKEALKNEITFLNKNEEDKFKKMMGYK